MVQIWFVYGVYGVVYMWYIWYGVFVCVANATATPNRQVQHFKTLVQIAKNR